MATNTTRLSLYKPGGGSTGLILPDEIADIDKINGNMDLIDAAIGSKNVTSTTRPAVPYEGQIIYETDTLKSYIRLGTLWVAVGMSRHSVATILAMSQIPGPVTGDICITNGIAGSTYSTEWIFSQTAWIPLGPVQAVSLAGLNAVVAAIPGGSNVAMNQSGVGALGIAAGITYQWNATTSTWSPLPYATAQGTASTNATGGTSAPLFWSAGIAISFPTGRFSVAPRVQVAVNSGGLCFATVNNVTTTGATITITRVGAYPTTSEVASWTAIQMLQGSADG